MSFLYLTLKISQAVQKSDRKGNHPQLLKSRGYWLPSESRYNYSFSSGLCVNTNTNEGVKKNEALMTAL